MNDVTTKDTGAESLSAWFGDDAKLKLADIGPEELGFVIERVFPQRQGQVGVMGTFRAYEFDQDGPEEFIARMFGGGRYTVRARKRGKYLPGARNVTIAGDPFEFKDSQRLVRESRGEEIEDEEENEAPMPSWGMPGAIPGMGVPPGYGARPSPYGNPNVPPPHSPAWRDPSFNPFMRGVKSDDPNQVAGAIQAMAAVLAAVKPAEAPPAADPSHLIATAMQAANQQTGPMMTHLVEELKDARKAASKPAAAETMQLESFRAMNKMQTEAMTSIFSMQGEMMKAQVEQSSVAMKEGLRLVGTIIKQAQDTDSGSFLDKLPDMLGDLVKPLVPAGGPPGGIPGAVPPGGPIPGAPMPVAAPPPAQVPQQQPAPQQLEQQDLEIAEYKLHQARQFVTALKFLVRAQPDPEEAWEQTMMAAIRVQQGSVRTKIEQLPPNATSDDFAKILVETGGVPAEEIIEVGQLAAATEGGLEWLAQFWAMAPWVPDDEEVVDSPPFVKEPGGDQAPPGGAPEDQ